MSWTFKINLEECMEFQWVGVEKKGGEHSGEGDSMSKVAELEKCVAYLKNRK